MVINGQGQIESVLQKLAYWRDYDGSGDEYRRTHDLDCILAGGDLNADTIISLWLPLRYTMNHFEMPRWQRWKEYEVEELRPKGIGLKNCPAFQEDMVENLDQFLDLEVELTQKLLILFELGQQRCNVMLLPKRSWNTLRGGAPYWDYLPHFLFNLFVYSADEEALCRWLKEQRLEPFFAGEEIARGNIRDLAGTGNPCRHRPREINLDELLNHYIAILRRRRELLSLCPAS